MAPPVQKKLPSAPKEDGPLNYFPCNAVNFPNPDTLDVDLMRSIAGGDAASFTLLYDRHSKLLYSIALHILADPEEANDVLQQVFLKVVTKASLCAPEAGKVPAWLCTLTRNQCLDRIRQMKSKQSLRETFYEESRCRNETNWRGERFGQFNDEVELLNGAMEALRPEERHVLKLAYFSGLTQTEIAGELSQPLGSVKARIRRALAKLRTALDGVIAPLYQGAAGPAS